MIVRVKTSFDSWRTLFEAKFREGKREVTKQSKVLKSELGQVEKFN